MNIFFRTLPAAALVLAAGVALAAEPVQPGSEKSPRSNSSRSHTLNPSVGSVRFGDGARGRRPARDRARSSNSYRKGGGTSGQVPSTLRHRNRAVSGKDFKELAAPPPAPPGRADVAPKRKPKSGERRLPAVQKPPRQKVSPKLNPQPEPPSAAANRLPAVQSPAGKVGINPQPEPPGRPGNKLPAIQKRAAPGAGDDVQLRPQPEPPGKSGTQLPAVQSPADKAGINPQPEPPGKGGFVPQQEQ